MKKAVSVLLVMLMAISCLSVAFVAEAAVADLPTVYIRGKNDPIYNNLGTPEEYMVSDSSRVSSRDVPDIAEYAKEKAKELVPMFLKALATGNYTAWAEKFSTVMEPIYRDFVLDNKGQPREGSGVKFDYSNIRNARDGSGNYHVMAYRFDYDWRLSPLDNADKLNDFINAVMRVTESDKINIISRCEGCSIAMAYLYRYGYEHISSTVFLGSSANGVCYASNIFAGKFTFDSDALNRYVGRNFATGSDSSFGDDLFDDEAVRIFLREFISLLAVSHGIDNPAKLILRVLNKIKPMVYPGLMMSSYGTCPAYWAMVSDEDYAEAKQLAGLNDNEEWADFVKLIDEYHDNVQVKAGEILNEMKENGVYAGIAVKYGAETYPVFENCTEINDDTTLAKHASFGATTAQFDKPFSDSYVASAVAAGKGDFISPDRMIDASTCALPDTTFFLKYCDHEIWIYYLEVFAADFLNAHGTLTVDSGSRYKRFMVYDKETDSATEMTPENCNIKSNYYETDKWTVFRSSFVAFFAMVRNWLGKLFNR